MTQLVSILVFWRFSAIVFASGFVAGTWLRRRAVRAERTKLEGELACARHEIRNLLEAQEARNRDALRWQQLRAAQDISDPVNQMRYVRAVKLYAVRPVNREAVEVLCAIEGWINRYNYRWRVAFEVSLGAFIKTESNIDPEAADRAFRSYSGKRVDFLVVDNAGRPRLAIEYNGTGHDLAVDAFDRMMVKRLALTKAQIPLIEIAAGTAKHDIQAAISHALASQSATGGAG